MLGIAASYVDVANFGDRICVGYAVFAVCVVGVRVCCFVVVAWCYVVTCLYGCAGGHSCCCVYLR